MSSRSDHCSSTHLSTPSHSRPGSKGHSIYQDLTKPTNAATLNVLFLGETDIWESPVIDLIADSVEQKTTSPRAGRYPSDDVRSVWLDGKRFMLYVSPANESMSTAARKEGIHDVLIFLRRNGGIHLLVYCINALHPLKWIHEAHHTIVSKSPSLRIPAVAAVAGISDAALQESWWSSTRDSLEDQGPHFDDHTFVRSTRSLTGDHISESRHALHVLILQNAKSDTSSDFQRATLYKQRSMGNSLQSLLVMLTRKPFLHAPVGSKPTDIVLLGEIGVGKSSLINLIARAEVAGVSSDTIGCTKTAVKYTFEEKGRIFHLYDTPGLVDPQMGDKPFFDPIDTIQQLIRSLGNGSGPDLVLFCIDDSKPTASFKRNYRIFYKFICNSKVPFALAVTKLEGGQGADQWWNKYGTALRRLGIGRSRYIGLGRKRGRLEPNADTEGRLREHLLLFLTACIDRQWNTVESLRSSVERVTSFVRSQASTPERALMKQCGLEEQTARELVNRIVSSNNKTQLNVSP